MAAMGEDYEMEDPVEKIKSSARVRKGRGFGVQDREYEERLNYESIDSTEGPGPMRSVGPHLSFALNHASNDQIFGVCGNEILHNMKPLTLLLSEHARRLTKDKINNCLKATPTWSGF